jgi:hypothetical protein
MVEEARLESVDSGVVPAGDGWFVVNVRDAAWLTNDAFGARCIFEADTPVVRGTELVEDEERQLLAWDFVHCPPGTRHAFVGAGDGPCVILSTGARTEDGTIVYPPSEAASRHGAAVAEETESPRVAYAPYQHWQRGRPANWDALPWA